MEGDIEVNVSDEEYDLPMERFEYPIITDEGLVSETACEPTGDLYNLNTSVAVLEI